MSERKLNIAALDSNSNFLSGLHHALSNHFKVSLFTEAGEMIESMSEASAYDLVLMDWHTANNGGRERTLEQLARLQTSTPSVPIILLTNSLELQRVMAVTSESAADVILKPIKTDETELAEQRCPKEVVTPLADEDDVVNEIPLDENTSFVRASKRMREIESQCRLVARAEIPVLILGESGTGKEVATLFIHKMSARGHRCFMKVNCAAMPADLLESELFGYEPGAFTGAIKSKPGKFEICNGGTIFLDEIGEMPAVLQAKLLQVLQDGSFSRLGSRTSVKVDVRVIAATNIDIKEAIARKAFREDLYYRLNGFTLKMPPLRERSEEIPVLANHFMRKVAAKYERTPLPISPVLLRAFNSYSWPGNLRELENTINRYLILNDEKAILDELSAWPGAASQAQYGEENRVDRSLKHLVKNLKGDAESAAIARSLEGTGWNRKVAASELKISYKALLYKIKQYNLIPPHRAHSSSLGNQA